MGRWAKDPGSQITHRTAAERVPVIVERDLCLLTGPELLAKYSKSPTYRDTFFSVTNQQIEAVAPTHCPIWHYALKVWFDNPDGMALLGDKHKELADRLVTFATGGYDDKDGFFYCWPRRAMKTTWMCVFADWAPKRHKVVDNLDIALLYSHNSQNKATRRSERIKQKNRKHPYIARVFPDFKIPDAEWGTKEEWNWPCRSETTSVAELSMTAMSAAGKKAGDGFQYKLLDDWEDEESRESPVIRESLADNYDQLRKLKAVPWSRELVQGTPYHTHSLYKPMIESKRPDGTPRYEAWVVPACDDNFTTPAFPTIPSLTLNGLAKERANEIARRGVDDTFFLQYLLKPNLTRTQAMSWSWFQPMTPAQWQARWGRIPHFKAVFVDSAWKGEEAQGQGCYTAIGCVAIFQMGPHTERVLLDLHMSNRMSSDEGARVMCAMMKRWGTTYWSCEQISDKPMVGLMKEVARNQTPPVYPYFIDLKGWSQKAKEARISMLAGSARVGHVYYLTSIDPTMLGLFKQEADTYPEDLHRDGLDMLANSFADSVVSSWVPVGLPMNEWVDPMAEPEAPVPTIGRYIPLPAYAVN